MAPPRRLARSGSCVSFGRTPRTSKIQRSTVTSMLQRRCTHSSLHHRVPTALCTTQTFQCRPSVLLKPDCSSRSGLRVPLTCAGPRSSRKPRDPPRVQVRLTAARPSRHQTRLPAPARSLTPLPRPRAPAPRREVLSLAGGSARQHALWRDGLQRIAAQHLPPWHSAEAPPRRPPSPRRPARTLAPGAPRHRASTTLHSPGADRAGRAVQEEQEPRRGGARSPPAAPATPRAHAVSPEPGTSEAGSSAAPGCGPPRGERPSAGRSSDAAAHSAPVDGGSDCAAALCEHAAKRNTACSTAQLSAPVDGGSDRPALRPTDGAPELPRPASALRQADAGSAGAGAGAGAGALMAALSDADAAMAQVRPILPERPGDAVCAAEHCAHQSRCSKDRESLLYISAD